VGAHQILSRQERMFFREPFRNLYRLTSQTHPANDAG